MDTNARITSRTRHFAPLQVQVAAADARPDLSLPAGKHDALVYVWCVRAAAKGNDFRLWEAGAIHCHAK